MAHFYNMWTSQHSNEDNETDFPIPRASLRALQGQIIISCGDPI